MKFNLFNIKTLVFLLALVNTLSFLTLPGSTQTNGYHLGTEVKYNTVSSSLSYTQTVQEPVIGRSINGEINWTDGYIIAYGKANILQGPDKNICYIIARRSAILSARTNALKLIEDINLDGDTSMKSFLINNSRWVYRLKSLIARTSAYEHHIKQGVYYVSIKVPFDGAYGIRSTFLYVNHASIPAHKESLMNSHRTVIDARGINFKPALFIKIKDQNSGKNVCAMENFNLSILRGDTAVNYITNTSLKSDDILIKALKACGNQNGNIIVQFSETEKITNNCPSYLLID